MEEVINEEWIRVLRRKIGNVIITWREKKTDRKPIELVQVPDTSKIHVFLFGARTRKKQRVVELVKA